MRIGVAQKMPEPVGPQIALVFEAEVPRQLAIKFGPTPGRK